MFGFVALLAGIALQHPAAFGFRREIASPVPDSTAVTASIDQRFSYCTTMPRRDCIVDGDTFYFGNDKVRIADIDTPEVFSPHCAEEKRLGDRATTRLHALLNSGPIELRRGRRDRDAYGRLLRTIYRDGRSLGDTLITEGLAHPWVGHRLPWCRSRRG